MQAPGKLRENTSLCGLTSSLTLAWPKVASRSRNKPATSNSIYYLNDTISSSLLPPPVLFSTPFLHCSLRLPSAPRPQHSTFLNFGLAVVSLTQFWQKWLRLPHRVCPWVNESRDSRLPSNSRTLYLLLWLTARSMRTIC
jgi:hypothetical protein